MSARHVVVVGDAMLDVYLSGDADLISREAPVPVVAVRTRRHGLGGAANVAANVAEIGAECRLVAVVGDDGPGDSLRACLAERGIADKYLVIEAARPTTSKMRVTARGQQVVRVDDEVDDPISSDTEGQVTTQLKRAMARADALLIEDYDKGTLTPVVIDVALQLARAQRVPVVVDPKFRNFFSYRGATVFKPNHHELERAMGATFDINCPGTLASLIGRLGVENLLVTLGAEGMALITSDRKVTRIPTTGREVFDVSGAGDTVTAWVGTALAAGATVSVAAQVGNYAAGVEVGKLGVATVSPAEVLTARGC